MAHSSSRVTDADMTTKTLTFGQVATSTILTVIATWLVTSVLNNPKVQGDQINAMETRVAVLEKSDANQDERFGEMRGDLKEIRSLVEEMSRRQGIVTKQTVGPVTKSQ